MEVYFSLHNNQTQINHDLLLPHNTANASVSINYVNITGQHGVSDIVRNLPKMNESPMSSE